MHVSYDSANADGPYAQRMEALEPKIREALGPNFTDEMFMGWVYQWLRPSRDFHGIGHMLEMTETSPGDIARSLERSGIREGTFTPEDIAQMAKVAMVTGFFHDEDYPSVEGASGISKSIIERYVEERDGKRFVKPVAPDDRIGQMVSGVFGYQDGQMLSPFPMFDGGKPVNPGGMNEYYCAVACATQLKEIGWDEKDILAVVTGIEATVPFRGKTRMDDLGDRVTRTAEGLGIALEPKEKDMMMVSATFIANKDVSSFLGGLDAERDTKPTVASVRATVRGGDRLNPEEIEGLRYVVKMDNTPPGDYKAEDFLRGQLKRAGLYQLVIPGKEETRSIDNMFHGGTLSDGQKYPSDAVVARENALVYENNEPARIATYARLISAGLVYALSHSDDRLRDATMHQLLDGSDRVLRPRLDPGASETRQLAFAALSGRDPGQYDISRSPIAEVILAKLDEKQVEAFGKEARGLLFAPPAELNDPQAFLEAAVEKLGPAVAQVKDTLEQTARSGRRHQVAEGFRSVELPRQLQP